ncbi:hypothetical protein ABZP36_016340 [Zizania latifolia]
MPTIAKRECEEEKLWEMGLDGMVDTRIGGWAHKAISGIVEEPKPTTTNPTPTCSGSRQATGAKPNKTQPNPPGGGPSRRRPVVALGTPYRASPSATSLPSCATI